MDTTKMTNYHISVWTLTNAWKADLTVTNVLTWREVIDVNVIRDTLQSATQLAALISMNVRCTMETALRSVSTRKAVTCVSAARDTMLLTLNRAIAKTLMSALRTMGRETATTPAQIRLDHSAAPVLRATTWELMVSPVMILMNVKLIMVTALRSV